MWKPWVLGFVEVWALAACGGGHSGSSPDAGVPGDSSSVDAALIDAPIDAGEVTSPPPCGFTEALDATNDATAEASALTVGTTDQSLCGTINTNHFDPDTGTVDIDSFRLTADGTAGLVVRLFGAAGAGAVRDLSVTIFDDQQALVASGTLHPALSNHAVFVAPLAAGDYTISITAQNATAPAAAFDYKLELLPDPSARCPQRTAPADYVEAADGVAGTGNDVVAVSFGDAVPYKLTDATDAAEPTQLTLGAVSPVRISGTSASVDAADDYMDRDTYLIHTGPSTNELTLRLAWADPNNDFDFIVFAAGHTDDVGDGLQSLPREEYNVVAVKPDTDYWIWVASHDGSTALPAGYDLSLCGAALVEPFAARHARSEVR
ncbi:MAG TPA: hypothetical protein VGC42_23260 [Kofleriaceae bacterium]